MIGKLGTCDRRSVDDKEERVSIILRHDRQQFFLAEVGMVPVLEDLHVGEECFTTLVNGGGQQFANRFPTLSDSESQCGAPPGRRFSEVSSLCTRCCTPPLQQPHISPGFAELGDALPDANLAKSAGVVQRDAVGVLREYPRLQGPDPIPL
jgi:hypothetical protein